MNLFSFFVSIILIPLVIIGLMYSLFRYWPRLVGYPPPPNLQLSRTTVWVLILSWFVLFLLEALVARKFPAPSLAIHLSRSWFDNYMSNRGAISQMVSEWLIDIAYIYFALRVSRLSLRDIGYRIFSWRRTVVWSIVASLNVLAYFFLILIGRQSFPISHSLNAAGLLYLLSNFLVTALLTAFIEETIFRGIFFTLLSTQYSVFVAWLIQAALFSLAHSFIQSPIGAFGPGLLFGLGLLGSGNILPGIFAHTLYNTTGILNRVNIGAS